MDSGMIYSDVRILDVKDAKKAPQNTLDNAVNMDGYFCLQDMPVIIQEASPVPLYNLSNVWIDPSRSQYVYNNYDTYENIIYEEPQISTFQFEEYGAYIAAKLAIPDESQVSNYFKPPVSPDNFNDLCKFSEPSNTDIYDQIDDINNLYDDDFEEGPLHHIILDEDMMNSGIEETIVDEETKNNSKDDITIIDEEIGLEEPHVDVECENSALKELMSRGSSKQMKTISYGGSDASCGETIQNISYCDSKFKCRKIEADLIKDIDNQSVTLPGQKRKKYQCDQCKQVFNRISAYRSHCANSSHVKEKNSKGQDFTCSKCGKVLKTLNKLKAHYEGHGNPDLECPICHKVYASKASLRVHKKIHERKYPCQNCTNSYAMHKDYINHLLKKHHIYRCKIEDCVYETNTSSQLEIHHIEHEILDDSSWDHPSETLKVEEVKVERKSKRRVKKPVAIIYEEMSHDSNRTDIDNESGYNSFSTSSLSTSPITTVEDDLFQTTDSFISDVFSNLIFSDNPKKIKKAKKFWDCPHCQKKFTRHNDLKRHIIEHAIRFTLEHTPVSKNGVMTFICGVCKKETFTKIDKYKAHLRRHAKMTIYQCTFCDKSFSDSSNFSKHKKTHGDAFYQCDMCKRKFHSKQMITKHMEYHMKTKPFNCKYCSKTFHFLSMLNKHMKVNHKITSQKFKCRFCDSIFMSVKEKWVHEWEGHGVRKEIIDCLKCGAQFRKYSELRKHSIEMHGELVSKASTGRKRKSSILEFK